MIEETWRSEKITREFIKKGYWGEETLTDYLDRTAQRFPHKVAVVDRGRRVTFHNLVKGVDRLAIRLLEIGIRKGDRVTMILPDWDEVYYLRYALGRIGAICCIGSIDWRGREIEHALRLTESVAVAIPRTFKDFDFLKTVMENSGKLSNLKHILLLDDRMPEGCLSLRKMIDEDLENDYAPDYLKQFRSAPNDIDKIQFTAGTTGPAKAAMRFPNNHIAIGRSVVERIRVSSEDRILSLAPISGGIGIVMAVYSTALSGATVILSERFDAVRALELIEREKATIVGAVPAQTIRILEEPSFSDFDLSFLRCWVTAGAPLPVKSWHDVAERLGCSIVTVYGSVDSGLAAVSSIDDPLEKVIGTAGRIIPYAEVRIVDDDGNPLSIGEEGEVVVRGGTVMAGYYKDAKATKERIDENGWASTGDYGILDSDDILRVVGRKKDLIIRGGENISPKELEDLIMTHPKVMEVAVLGVPDPVLGERACACVIPKAGETVSFDELTGFLRSKEIEIHKLPERLEVMDHFPMSEGGKIQKHKLREMIVGKMEKG
jgi:cyclohexanecarboxylate-CoA ligase